MKKTYKLMSVIMALVISLSIGAPLAYATETSDASREAYTMEDGSTMYLEETSAYRIVYHVKNDGGITYSVCYENEPHIAYTGRSSLAEISDSQRVKAVFGEDSFSDIADKLLALEPEEITDFAARPMPISITTEEALRYAKNYAPGWETPVLLQRLGTYKSGSITVNVSKTVNGLIYEQSVVYYYLNDLVTSIIASCRNFNLTKGLRAITNIKNAAGDYVAQRNGTLSYFGADNTRTKIAAISGETYYMTGWDMKYGIYSGDKATFVEVLWENKGREYDESVSYLGQQAINRYP